MLRGRLVTAIVVTGAIAVMAWKKKDGWIGSCPAAGCLGMQSICLEYVVNGHRYYCYRNNTER